jgi:hypothetical protein
MATLQIHTTKGTPLSVIYPAKKPAGYSATVRFRIGKKTMLPAYTDANLPHLVQFQSGQRIIMFMLRDLLQGSYWQKIRNAYNFLGQLDIDKDLKVGIEETVRVTDWLKVQGMELGVIPVAPPDAREASYASC